VATPVATKKESGDRSPHSRNETTSPGPLTIEAVFPFRRAALSTVPKATMFPKPLAADNGGGSRRVSEKPGRLTGLVVAALTIDVDGAAQ
jgi:hypothetical protein